MFVAFDDTDSLESMCTTFLATEVIKALRGYDLIGLPRLVRLNPAVPWKTRGNGALCVRFGVGRGKCNMVGEIDGAPIYSYNRMYEEADRQMVLRTAQAIVGKWSRTREGASPGLVVSLQKPAQRLYWEAVRGIVEKEGTLRELQRIGADLVGWEGGRGIIGASAAMAWRPHDSTYEIITYRQPERWGTPRYLDDGSVRDMDLRFPSTFNNFDHRTGRRAISPHTPCPVLFGVRGDDPQELMSAVFSLRSEPPSRWMMFLTNQGTDDHLIRAEPELPDRSYDFFATVAGTPTTVQGGHVIVPVSTKKGQLECAAYEPTKEFRDVVRALRLGDRLRLFGELRAEPRTLNIEKLQVVSTAPELRKVSNPRCPACGGPTKSIGSSGGYRCKKCGAKNDLPPATAEVPRSISPGWYEPPVCARRHLGKPLKRMGL
ncbi:MAG: tRNA(Ile)(2)-agmatinylcytidine synthase [Methanomassiliicoccales archaeon]|nr:tRNA(Ile)(2)-agmatinylcytidine synthase [Methanomassiliicoccales archaeon]